MGAVKDTFFDLHDCNGDSDWPEFWLADHPNPCPICGTKWGDRHKAMRDHMDRQAKAHRDPLNAYDPVF
jgi:hypothetical protein